MNTVLVTCVYSKAYAREDITQPGDNGIDEVRYQRFHFSLISISNTQVPIVIFTNKNYVEFLQTFCNDNLKHKNFKIIGLNLEDLPYYSQIDDLKRYNLELNPLGNRYCQIVLSKPYLIKYAIDNNLFNGDKYFWIDAGLSYVSLIPNRYRSGGERDWYSYNCFDQSFIQRIENYSQNKMFVIIFNPGKGNPYLHEEGIYKPRNEDYGNWYMIGGLWGGNKFDMLPFYELYIDHLATVINFWKNNKKSEQVRIFYEESIFSAIIYNNPENYFAQRFDTWYHENDWSQVHNIKPGDRNFYKIITGES